MVVLTASDGDGASELQEKLVRCILELNTPLTREKLKEHPGESAVTTGLATAPGQQAYLAD